MHNIDINFLRDRKLDSQIVGTSLRKKPETPIGEKLPMFIGVGVGVAFIALSGGALLFLNGQKGVLNQEIAEVQSEIDRLQVQNEQIATIQTEIDQVTQETQALASVFENIKPWSALLEEIRLLIPATVQIKSISQTGTKDLTIEGVANDYDDINDFLITLKNSKFLSGEDTVLKSSSKTDNPNQVQQLDGSGLQTVATNEGNQPIVQLPQMVSFNITTRVNDTSSADLVNYLRRRGAIGLVTRIQTLEQKGAIKP